MQKLKELFTDTLIYGVSSVLARFINYLLVPLHTKVFSTGQYGVIGLIYAATAFLNVLFTFGMESAYLRYGKDRRETRDVFKTVQSALLLTSTLLALLLWLFSPLIMPLIELLPETEAVYLMMIGILWFDTLGIVPFAELRLVRKAWLYAVLRTVHVIINIFLNLYLILGLDMGIEAVFIANLAASGLVTLALWLITSDLLKGTFNKAVLKKMALFGLPFVPAGLGFVVNEMIDRFFLGNYLDAETAAALYGAGTAPIEVVGIYSACYKLAAFMLLLIQMFRMAWQPFFLQHSEDDDAPALFADTFLYFNIAAAAVFLGVALFVEKIVQIRIPFLDAYLIAPEFWEGLAIVPVILAAYWFHGWYMNFSAGIFIREKTAVLPKITLIGAAVTVIANLALIPFFGMMGSAWATLFSYALMALLLFKKSTDLFAVPYSVLRAGSMLVIAGLCVFIQPAVTGWIGSEWTASIFLFISGIGGICALGLSGTHSASKTIN